MGTVLQCQMLYVLLSCRFWVVNTNALLTLPPGISQLCPLALCLQMSQPKNQKHHGLEGGGGHLVNAEDIVDQRFEEAETGLPHNCFCCFLDSHFNWKKTPNRLIYVWVRRNCYCNSLLKEMSPRGLASRHVHCEHGSFVCWSPGNEELKYGML